MHSSDVSVAPSKFSACTVVGNRETAWWAEGSVRA